MNPIIKNILAIIVGIVVGGAVNMSIINVSGSIIPPPEGADVTTMEGLKATIHLFKPINFLMPFLAHALGTLVSAFLASLLAANNKMRIALGLGMFSLIGGITAVYMLPAPMWYNVVDLVGAYFPMAFIGGKLGMKFAPQKAN
jgi:hypothetical protein